MRFVSKRNKIYVTGSALCMMTLPMRVHAAMSWTGIIEKWHPVYEKFEPWIGRCAILLMLFGFVEMFYAYSADGAYGLTKGLNKAVAGVVLALIWRVLKELYV